MSSIEVSDFWNTEELSLLQEYISRRRAEESFYEFVKQAWGSVEGDTPFIDNWHIKAICDHIQACLTRDVQNLIINIPPRCCKSTLVSVMLPAWVWIHDPSEKFLYASYASSLSVRDSVKCRRLILSPYYQNRWGHLYSLMPDNNLKSRFENNKHGCRIAGSVGSSITGEGGTWLVIDDANNAVDGESEVIRQGTIDWWSQVFSTRLNNQKTGIRINIQQRLHSQDLTGHIIDTDYHQKWVKLILPMEYEESRGCETIVLPGTEKRWKDPRDTNGQLLWPERIGKSELDQIKRDLRSAYNIAGQLQQSPSPSEGGIFKKTHFKWWKLERPPKMEFVIASWDTALSDKEFNTAYSACTVWGYFKDASGIWSIILLNMFKDRIPFTDLRKIVKRMADDYRDDGKTDIRPDSKHSCDLVLVEAKANGLSLIQELRAAGVNAFRFDPKGDKVARAQIASSYAECGCVYLPAMPPSFKNLRPMADEFMDLCAKFPMDNESKDVVDTYSQAVIHLRDRGYFRNPGDKDIALKNTKPKHGFYGAEMD